MMGDHHGRAAERASPLVRATDEIFGTHSFVGGGSCNPVINQLEWNAAAFAR
jgi:hypothetical protein